jgi:DUF971 family protein
MAVRARSTTPQEVTLVSPKELSIRWDDGHQSSYDADYLRLQCRCDQCTSSDNMASRMLVQALLMDDGLDFSSVEILDVRAFGSVGLAFLFSDGHGDWVYTFEHLRAICPEELGGRT